MRRQAARAQQRRAVVIGGGVAGLATAGLLARAGYAVDLVEQRADLGGRAGVWETEGFRFDTGPSWYLMPEVYDHFFELMGTSAEEQLDLRRLDGYDVFFDDHDERLRLGTTKQENVAAFEAVEPGAGEALEDYLRSAEETYRLALQHFLYTSFTSKRSLLRPALLRRAARLGGLLTRSLRAHVDARFDDDRLRRVLGFPAVFLGTSPERAPSMYHLMSWLDLADGVYHPMGGFARLVEVLAELATGAGVQVHTACTATAIRSSTASGRGRARVTGVEVEDAHGRRQILLGEVVVAAADLHHVETELVPPQLRTFPESWWSHRDPGPSAVLAHLGVRGRLPELPHHSLFFTSDVAQNYRDIFESPTQVPDPASAYVCRASATDAGTAPEDHDALFVLVPVPADTAIGYGGLDGRGDPEVEKVVDAAVARVAERAGVPDLAERIVVRRTVGPADFADDYNAWSGGALGMAHVLRQSAFLRAGNASKHVDGLYYAGSSTLPGVGVPMCLISAELVLKRLLGDRSTRPLPTPVVPDMSRRTRR